MFQNDFFLITNTFTDFIASSTDFLWMGGIKAIKNLVRPSKRVTIEIKSLFTNEIS